MTPKICVYLHCTYLPRSSKPRAVHHNNTNNFRPNKDRKCARANHMRYIGSTLKNAPPRPPAPGLCSPDVWARSPRPSYRAPTPRGFPARLRERLAERCRSRNRNPRRRGTPTPGQAQLMCVRGRPTPRCPLPPRCHLSVFPASSSSRNVEGLTHVRNSTN